MKYDFKFTSADWQRFTLSECFLVIVIYLVECQFYGSTDCCAWYSYVLYGKLAVKNNAVITVDTE